MAAAISAVHAMLAQAEALFFSSDRIVLGGFGQGAALALAAGRSYRKPLGGIMLLSGWAAGPCTAVEANIATPILLLHGENDTTISHHLLHESATALRFKHGANVLEHSIAGAGHASSPNAVAQVLEFLRVRLPEAAADASKPSIPPPSMPAQSKSVIRMGGKRTADGSQPAISNPLPADGTMPSNAGQLASVRVSMHEGEVKVVVPLPQVASMDGLDLSMSSSEMRLDVAGQLETLLIPFPDAVDADTARAKFSKKTRELTVALKLLRVTS
jgi:hypothetical protein